MSTQKVKFVLAAEIVADATNGLLLGEFNNWDKESGFSLKKAKDGSMEATVSLEAGRSYQYRYLLDGGRWENDHRADGYFQVEGHDVFNCVINVPVVEVKTEKPKKAVSSAQPKKAGKKIEVPSEVPVEKPVVKAKSSAKTPATDKKPKAAVKPAVKPAATKSEVKPVAKPATAAASKKKPGAAKAK